MRWLAALLASALSGCGDSSKPPSIAAVNSCLEGKGLRVIGGAAERAADDTDQPDRGELITAGAFIAFYSSEDVADELANGVEDNAERMNATVEHKGTVTVVYIDTKLKDKIDPCIEP